jgi:molybdopterin-guanine dinucleotide biosynthesis protein A
MGQDKALVTYKGRPLIEHAISLLKASELEPHIVGHRPDLARYAPVIPDRHSDCGPLGGIEAALVASSSDFNVFLPVDLPLLPAAFLRYLSQRAVITGAAATIPASIGKPQPLCAIYHRDLLHGITRWIEEGNYKVMHAMKDAAKRFGGSVDLFSVEAVVAARDGLSQQMPAHRWFQNMNTPADMALLA